MDVDSTWQDWITEQYEQAFKEELVVAESELTGDFVHTILGGGFESCQD